MTGHRDTPGVIAPPPLIFLAFLLAGWGLTSAAPDTLLAAPVGLPLDLRRGLGVALIVLGLILDGAAAGQFRRVGTRPEPWKPSEALATGGVYRLSRNPMYVGFALIYVGFAVAMDSLAVLLLLIPCLVIVDQLVIRREERYMAARFGADYEAYRARVRRWL